MTTFALVDCNNFYASCERLFRPDLKQRPVAVLSNNDGCIVARSQEVKNLGIKTGTPVFKVKELLKKHQVQVFSSNYTLYGDISARVMQTLEGFAPSLEIYSIDEAFLDLSGFPNVAEYGRKIRATVYKNVGIPVCVGIAPTKTLAKLANNAAKRYAATAGVVDLGATTRQQKLLAITPVAEVWGIGRKHAQSLSDRGIGTALDLANIDRRQLRRHYSVVVERTVRELNGESCIDLDHAPPAKQQIVCSRSFGSRISDYAPLRETICEFVARAAQKLRAEHQLARNITIFIRTSTFNAKEPQYANSATGKLSYPSCDTRDLLAMSSTLLDSIYRVNYRYAKAGVMLGDFCSDKIQQFELFAPPTNGSHSAQLMQAIDAINNRGQGKIWFAGQRPVRDWFMKQELISPAYTTRWDSLPLV